MSCRRGLVLALLVVVLAATLGWAHRTPPPDPLRLVPPDAYFLVKVDKPLPVVRWFLEQATRPELQQFAGYREFLESTGVRRGQQLLAYIEKEVGRAWPELINDLARGGIVLATDLPSPGQKIQLLMVIQSDQPALAKKALATFIDVATQELARLESKLAYTYETYHGVSVAKLGDEFAVAATPSGAIVAANSVATLKAALDRERDDQAPSVRTAPGLQAARSQIPEDALGWAWLDLTGAKQQDGLKNLMELPVSDPIPHIILGGWFDVVRRSDFLTLDLRADGPDLMLSLRLPAGIEGMSAGGQAHSRTVDAPGPRPLFWPADAFYATSFVWDPSLFWTRRKEFFTEGVVKDLEEGDRASGPVLLGRRLSVLLATWGPRHQFVASRPHDSGYSITPRQKQPSFALISELRDPEGFAKNVEPVLRAGAFLGGLNVAMRMSEVPHGGYKIVSYRFVENESNRQLQGGVLFNFTPSFVRVRDHVIVASTLDLAKTLVDEVERGTQATSWSEPASSRHRLSLPGLSLFLESQRAQLETQNILQAGLTPAQAREQLEGALRLLEQLGSIDLQVIYGPTSFQAELRTTLPRKP